MVYVERKTMVTNPKRSKQAAKINAKERKKNGFRFKNLFPFYQYIDYTSTDIYYNIKHTLLLSLTNRVLGCNWAIKQCAVLEALGPAPDRAIRIPFSHKARSRL